MVAPLDSRSEFEVDGERYQLAINFGTLVTAEAGGVDLLGAGLRAVIQSGTTRVAILLAALLGEQRPEMTPETALPLLIRAPEEAMKALKAVHDGMFGDVTVPLDGAGGKRKASKSASA